MVKYLQKNKHNGFTFVEMLLVLSSLSILIMLAQPLQISILHQQQEKHFFKTVLTDLLYLQNVAITTGQSAQIIFSDNFYKVEVDNITKKRQIYPENLNKTKNVMNTIRFNENGTASQLGTIKFKSNEKIYHIVCPFGKSRCYVREQS